MCVYCKYMPNFLSVERQKAIFNTCDIAKAINKLTNRGYLDIESLI